MKTKSDGCLVGIYSKHPNNIVYCLGVLLLLKVI